MPAPRPHAATNVQQGTPIGQVIATVYELAPGKTEVMVQFPADAVSGAPDAAAKQASFSSLVLAEVENALKNIG